MTSEPILENVAERSKELFSALASLRADGSLAPHILDVRGAGLMVGVEFASPTGSGYDVSVKRAAPQGLAARVAKRCQEKGLFILTTSVYQVREVSRLG